MHARTVLALILLIPPLSLTGCAPVAPVPETSVLMISVRNESLETVPLAVATYDSLGTIVGVAEPDEVPPRTTLTVRFRVPVGEEWVILANGGSTIGSADVRDRFPGHSNMSIEVDFYGDARFQCTGDCP